MRNTSFRGVRPRSMDDTLENNFASYASNCVLYDGAIRPLRVPEYVGQAVDTDGHHIQSGMKRLHVAGDVLVGFNYETFVAPDPLDRGGRDSFLFVKDGKLMRSSPSWVLDHQGAVEVGICPPKNPPLVNLTGEKCAPTYDIELEGCMEDQFTFDCQDNKSVVSFIYTYVTACHEESAPSYPSEPLTIQTDDQVALIANEQPPENAVARRWYVAIPTGDTTTWFLVAETPIEQVLLPYCHTVFSFNDILQTEDYNAPPTCLQGVGIIGDATTFVWQNRDIWFSEPNQPHAYPSRHRQTIEDNILAVVNLNDQSVGGGVPYLNVILTDGHPYLMRGNLPEEVTITRLNRDAPCLNPQGVMSYEGNVFYTSTDGLYRITDASVYNITTEWFTLAEWAKLNPRDLKIGYYNDRLFAFSNSGDGIMFKYTRENNQHQFDCVYITAWYEAVQAQRGGELYVSGGSGDVYTWEKGHTRMTAVWRSKLFTQSGLWKPTSAKVIADTHDFALGEAREAYMLMTHEQADLAPFYCIDQFLVRHPEYVRYYDYLVTQVIEFGIYADDREVYRRTVKNQKPFRLKRDRRRIYWAYQVRTQTDIREIHVQTAMDDLSQEGGHA